MSTPILKPRLQMKQQQEVWSTLVIGSSSVSLDG